MYVVDILSLKEDIPKGGPNYGRSPWAPTFLDPTLQILMFRNNGTSFRQCQHSLEATIAAFLATLWVSAV